MPHVELSGAALDAEYPSLEAPEEELLQDMTNLEDDALYNKGMKIVQGIIQDMVAHGRRRRADNG